MHQNRFATFCLQLVAALLLPAYANAQEPLDPGPLLDQETLTWSIDPPGAFHTATVNNSHDGEDALAFWSTNFADTVLSTTIQGPALVSWWWRRTDEESDSPDIDLYFIYDGNRLADHDDDESWERVAIQIPSGQHTLEWLVPASMLDNDQKAYLDDISVTPGGSLPEVAAIGDSTGVWLRTELGTSWKESSTISHDEISAAEATTTAKSQGTSLRRLVSGPTQISWWWQMTGPQFERNELKAKLRAISPDNTSLVTRWDLNTATPWEKVTAVVPPGLHVINWRYEYDNPLSGNSPAADAGGYVDEFTSAPLGLQEVLALPDQIWNFEGNWSVTPESADTETPGSISLSQLNGAGEAGDTGYLESTFTGPILLQWYDQFSSGDLFANEMIFSIDGIDTPEALIGLTDQRAQWRQRSALVPAGPHTVRWTFRNTNASTLFSAVSFDNPQPLPALSNPSLAAFDTSGPQIYESADHQSTVVSNAPDEPAGDTALRLSQEGSPFVVMGGEGGFPIPALVSYYHRRVGGNNNDNFKERQDDDYEQSISTTETWSKRRVFISEPTVLSWSIWPDSPPIELDGFSNDSPIVDPSLWLELSGLDWDIVEPESVIARTWDDSIAAPNGDRLFLIQQNEVQTLLTAPVISAGLLTLEVQRMSGFGDSVTIFADGQPTTRAVTRDGDTSTLRFGVPHGSQEISLSVSGLSANIISMSWAPEAGDVDAGLVHEGLGAKNLNFTISPASNSSVTDDLFFDRRVFTLGPALPAPVLRTTIQGPGTLSFDWFSNQDFGNSGSVAMGEPSVIVTQTSGSYGWARVRIPVPPGEHPISWTYTGSTPLKLNEMSWEPAGIVTNSPPDPRSSMQREGDRLWFENRSNEVVLVAPWDRQTGGESPLTIEVEGSGMFVCDARLLSSSLLPHYDLMSGSVALSLAQDDTASLRTGISQQWRTLCLPVEAGVHTLDFSLVFGEEWGGLGIDPLLPAAMELRSASLAPIEPLENLNQPGLVWEATPLSAVTGANAETSNGPSTVWNLAIGDNASPPNQLAAIIIGPGILEWDSTHDDGTRSIATNGEMATSLLSESFGPPDFPNHQLVLPAGTHRVIWAQYRNQFNFSADRLDLGLAVRWIPGADPVLPTAVGLSLEQYSHFASDGGWEPIPFDPTEPRLRLRARFAGTASISFAPQPHPFADPVWHVTPNWGADIVIEQIDSVFTHPGTTAIDWNTPEGERGRILTPHSVPKVGKIISSGAQAGETFEQWATRHGVEPNPLDDSDGDGFQLLIESALGLDPRLAEPGAIYAAAGDPTRIRIPWPANTPSGVTRSIEASSDLRSWVPTDFTVMEREAVAEIILASQLKFVRVRVTQE